MIPQLASLVKYDNPVLVSTSRDKDKKLKDKGKKVGCPARLRTPRSA